MPRITPCPERPGIYDRVDAVEDKAANPSNEKIQPPMEKLQSTRPEYRNIGISQIAKYRLPWAGKVSILHRVSGALMFLLLPFVLYLFEQSITSELSFAKFSALMSGGFVKLVVLALIWGYLHHFCAGIRFLLLDVHVGVSKPASAKSAISVLVVSLLLTLIFGLKLFGLF